MKTVIRTASNLTGLFFLSSRDVIFPIFLHIFIPCIFHIWVHIFVLCLEMCQNPPETRQYHVSHWCLIFSDAFSSITAAVPVNIVAILHIFSEEFLQQLLEMCNLSPLMYLL